MVALCHPPFTNVMATRIQLTALVGSWGRIQIYAHLSKNPTITVRDESLVKNDAPMIDSLAHIFNESLISDIV